MRKVLSFSVFLVAGLVLSQSLSVLVGTEGIGAVRTVANILLYVCLSFIMINVGREFEVDKSRWKSYTQDYFIAMATAAMPWFLIALYYVFVLLPPEFWNSWEAWKENLLLSRFAAPTSAGILFTMLAAIGLKSSWMYKKIQVLAIFDDLDTILLMIPLQIMMIGLRWQLIIVVLIVFLLLSFGWKQLGKYNWRQDWKAILFYSFLVFIATQSLYLISKSLYGEAGSIHIEVQKQELFYKISISDTGKGIAPERQAEIFTRFYREPEVYDQPGVGIGLYLARKIIELQNGYIEVQSEIGNGSCFCLYFPVKNE